jgi:hypothetical protein
LALSCDKLVDQSILSVFQFRYYLFWLLFVVIYILKQMATPLNEVSPAEESIPVLNSAVVPSGRGRTCCCG